MTVAVKQYVVVVPPGIWQTVVVAAARYGLSLQPVPGGTAQSPAYVPVLAPPVDLAVLTTVPDRPRRPEVSLTPQQMIVLRGLGAGLSDRQIAEQIHVSESTVSTHIRRVFRRLGVHTRGEAVAAAYRLRLLDADQMGGDPR